MDGARTPGLLRRHLLSARLGVLEPLRDFFERIARVIGPQNEPPLFFDDSEEVVRAAVAYGWEGVLFESVESCTRTSRDTRAS